MAGIYGKALAEKRVRVVDYAAVGVVSYFIGHQNIDAVNLCG